MLNRSPILWFHFCFFVILSSFITSCGCQRPEIDFEWQGSKRAIVLEDENAMKPGETPRLSFKRGRLCGWTPHGLCFSPDHFGDIDNFFVIPFNLLKELVFSDQPTNLRKSTIFKSKILAFFDKAKDKSSPWLASVTRYRMIGLQIRSLVAKTNHESLGSNQVEQTFLPHQVRVEGAHNACIFFKTNCEHNEYCIPRTVNGHISPGEYRCECKEGWQYARGRGCLDIDECKGKPCAAYHFCVNTPGSFSCQCRTGYTGPKCNDDIDECQTKSCPDNSICKNTRGNFTCTCKEGYAGKTCSDTSEEGAVIISEEGDPILTFRVIKMFSKRKLIIPRNKPAVIIRKTVFVNEPGTKESAIMASLIVFLCLLGGYLFWDQKRKRLKEDENLQDKSDQSMEDIDILENSENRGTIPNAQ